MKKITALACAATMLAPGAVLAQPATGATQRAEDFASYVAAAAICNQIGWVVDPRQFDPAENMIEASLRREGMSAGEAEAFLGAAIDRQTKLSEQDLDALLVSLKTQKPARPAVLETFSGYDSRCAKAAAAGEFAAIIKRHPDHDRLFAENTDSFLVGLGEASWQTPAVMARGDVYMAVGACRDHLQESEVAKWRAQFAASSALPEKVRAYYEDSYEAGIKAAAGIKSTPANCRTAIDGLAARVQQAAAN